MAVVAQSYMLRDLIPEALDWADRALAEADHLGGQRGAAVRANALVEKGSALVVDGSRCDEGDELLELAADIGEDLGDDVVVARALHNLVRTDTRPRDAAVARRQLDRMRAAAERVGFDSMAGAAHAQGLADLAQWEGDLGAALDALAEGRRARPRVPPHQPGWVVQRPRGRACCSRRGNRERAAGGRGAPGGGSDQEAVLVQRAWPPTSPPGSATSTGLASTSPR